MKKILVKFFLSSFYSFVFIIVWNVVTLTFFPVEGVADLRFGVNSLFVVYFVIKKQGSYLPWGIFAIEIIQSLFSVASWGQHVLGGLFILILARFLREVINAKHSVASFFLVEALLVIRYMVLALLWALKIEGLGHWPEMVIDYLPQSIVLSLLSIPLFKFFDYIWPQASLDGDIELGHV